MSLPLSRRDAPLFVAVVAGLLALAVAITTAVWAARINDSARRADDRSHAVSDSAERLTALVVDAETGQRGFLLTGHDRYLRAYRVADAQMPAELRQLEALTTGDRVASSRVAELRRAIASRMNEMSTTIRLRRRAGLDAALPVVESDTGQPLMEEIRRLGAELQASAEAAAQREAEQSRDAGRIARTIGLTAGGVALALLVTMLALLLQRAKLSKAKLAAESARESLSAQLTQLSTRDALTGLPNRQLLEDRLAQALHRAERDGTLLALLFINIDDFGRINETRGHLAGDALLADVGQQLAGQLNPSDTVARWGGDEFVAVCEGLVQREDAGTAAARVRDALATGLVVDGHPVDLTASIGVVVSSHLAVMGSDEVTPSPQALLSSADTAMHQAKDEGGARVHVYDGSTARHRSERHRLLADLRRAATGSELWLAYQPLVELDGGRVVGAEALARWDHPSRGSIPPAEFVTLAEDSDLIIDIGKTVLRQACLQAGAWNSRRRPLGLPPLKMSVNVSARQLLDPEFVDITDRALESGHLAPGDLTLEITETALVEGAQLVTQHLDELTERGVTIALDDFGTGYSSLVYLRQFPIGLIKIDRSFTAGMVENHADRTIVRTIIGLAHNLERPVLAEGIETAEQARQLLALGCAFGQGYRFGRPLSADNLTSMMTTAAASVG